MLGKPEQGQGSGAFKIGDLTTVKHRLDFTDQAGKILLADVTVADPEAFTHRAEMGRGVKTGLITGSSENGTECCAHRAFTVGATDVDAL
ncbi:hypothetical protein H206_05358 [Candidatus Electrothrix aarhusensis]|uniref:Uncharacterized protein n=1 Tax=Candidatus Electrothrix aarhusensis TaxID=1859131 RepID=A0A3S3UE38_9BACT|nr:hypothetical protein H206_05358 [Candidatus Electrothrix aarhusensis]